MIDQFLSESPWALIGLVVLAFGGVVGLFVNLHLQLRARSRRFHQRLHQGAPSLDELLVRARLGRLQQPTDREGDAA